MGVACGAGTRAVLEARKEGSETPNVRGEVRGTREGQREVSGSHRDKPGWEFLRQTSEAPNH